LNPLAALTQWTPSFAALTAQRLSFHQISQLPEFLLDPAKVPAAWANWLIFTRWGLSTKFSSTPHRLVISFDYNIPLETAKGRRSKCKAFRFLWPLQGSLLWWRKRFSNPCYSCHASHWRYLICHWLPFPLE
jgi:hypothetical protein